MSHTIQKILCVDDEPVNLRLLKEMLKPQGYEVITAGNGAEALENIQREGIDLVLLDLIMPEIDGIEVCRKIKESDNYRDIPVVIVTSMTSRKDRLACIKAGADDFLTKPVDAQELLARCRNLLRMKKYRDEVVIKNQELEKLQKLKDDLVAMIVHDLKTPLTGISGNLELALMGTTLNDKVLKYLSQAEYSSYSLLNMINALLDIHMMEEGKLQIKKGKIDVASLFQKIEGVCSARAEKEDKRIIIDNACNVEFEADRDLMERVLQNLVANALKHVEKGSGEVKLTAFEKANNIVFEVSDNGEGIPAGYHEKIFDKFARVETKKRGLPTDRGLGLAFCKMAIEAHRGRIWVESESEKGSKFSFVIPIRKE